MKLNKILIAMTLIGLLALVSCKEEGISKEQRLADFKTDIRGDNNPVGNFRGHPNSTTITSTTFDAVQWTSADSIAFPGGDFIGDSTFTIMYTNVLELSAVGSDGIFYKEVGSGNSGDDWYIYSITVDGQTFPASSP